MKKINFKWSGSSLFDACIAFRNAVSIIPTLRFSLLGNYPKVFEGDDSFSVLDHKIARRFYDMEGIDKFVEYLNGLMIPEPHPNPGTDVFSLTGRRATGPTLLKCRVVSNKNEAAIVITAKDGRYSVSVSASFNKNPKVARQKLLQAGFVDEGPTNEKPA